jgi:hypothetical protein
MGLEDEEEIGDSEALAWVAGDKVEENTSNTCEIESFSVRDISPSGVLGWITGVKHRELGSCNRSTHMSFDHDCKNRNPNHNMLPSCWYLWSCYYFSSFTYEFWCKFQTCPSIGHKQITSVWKAIAHFSPTFITHDALRSAVQPLMNSQVIP